MRIESNRPYGLPRTPEEIKEGAPERPAKLPGSTVTPQGDQFELSVEQRVTQDILSVMTSENSDVTLSSERLLSIQAKLKSGHYLTDEAADLTAKSLLSFHK